MLGLLVGALLVLWLSFGDFECSGVTTLQSSPDSTGHIQVQPLGPAPIHADPGTTITAAVRLENQSDSPRTVRPAVDGPSPWTLGPSLSPVTLSAGAHVVQQFSVSVPPQAPARREHLRVHVVDTASLSVADSTRLPVQVRASARSSPAPSSNEPDSTGAVQASADITSSATDNGPPLPLVSVGLPPLSSFAGQCGGYKTPFSLYDWMRQRGASRSEAFPPVPQGCPGFDRDIHSHRKHRSNLKARPSERSPDATGHIQIQHLGPAPIHADPGATITTAFRVHNRSDTPRTVRPTVDVPSTWTLATSLSSVTLSAGEDVLRLLSVSVPSQAPARREQLRVRVADAASPSPADSASVDVQVRPVRRLRLSLLNAPEQVTARDDYVATFAVTNTGNVPTQVHLQARSARSFRAQVDSSIVRLPPSATTQGAATVHTARVERAREDHLTVQATPRPPSPEASSAPAGDTADSTIVARTSVEVIPASTDDGPPTAQYPVSVRLQTVGNARSQGGQIELQGANGLGSDLARRLDFFLRSPSQHLSSPFGRHDVYRATYTTDRWTLRGGDHVYETTPLAAPGRYGFGGEVRRQTGNWTVGAYVQTERRSNTGSQIASYASYDLNSSADLTASVLHNEGFFQGTLATLQGQFVPWKNASLAVESGMGRSPEGLGTGVRIELSGEHPWGNYRTRHLYTDSQFPNSRGGQRLSTAHARLRLAKNAVVFGTAQYRRRTLFSTSLPLVYKSAQFGGSMRGSLGPNQWSLRLNGRVEGRPYHDERSVRLQGRLQTGRLGLGTTVRLGQRAFGNAPRTPFQSYRGHVSLHTSGQRFYGFAEYTRRPVYSASPSESTMSVGATSRTQIGDHTTLFLEAEWRHLLGETVLPQRSLSLDLQHELPFGHTIMAEVRMNEYRRFHNARSPAFKVSYDIPVDLPLPSDPEQKMLTGRVVHAETGTGVADALVQLGSAKRFTDDSGHFSLPRPRNGTAYLRLDRSTVDGADVPMLDLPLPIRPSESPSTLVIPIRESGTLTVQVTEYDYPNLRTALRGGAPDSVGTLDNAILEATDTFGRKRQLTNDRGRATFKHLRPGTWTIRLVNPQLSEDQVVEQNTVEVTIPPGGHETLNIRVLPKRRTIDIRQGKSLSPDSGSR